MSLSDELKEQREKAGIDVHHSEQEMSSEEKEGLKEDLKEQREEGDAAVASVVAEQDKLTQKDVLSVLQRPVEKKDDERWYRVGNWGEYMCEYYNNLIDSNDATLSEEERLEAKKWLVSTTKAMAFKDESGTSSMPENHNKDISANLNVVLEDDDRAHDNALGYFIPYTQKITLHKYLPSEFLVQDGSIDAEYELGNPFAEVNVLMHENAHREHFVYDGVGQLYNTPVNCAKKDRLTETVACATQYLHAAQTYEYLKEQGFSTFVYTQNQTLVKAYENYKNSDEAEKGDFVSYLKNKGVDKLRFADEERLFLILGDYDRMPEENKPLLSDWLKERGIKELTLEDDLENFEIQKKVSVDELAEKLNQKGKSSVGIAKECGVNVLAKCRYFNDKKVEDCLKRDEQGVVSEDYIRMECGQGAYLSMESRQPIESILEQFDGLKEVVLEEGFDAKDPKKVRKVVEASSKYWHTERKVPYQSQMIASTKCGAFCFSRKSWSQQMEALKNEDKVYRQVSEKMLKDVYIGNNTTVDLSSCRDLLDTASTRYVKASVSSYNTCEADGKVKDKISLLSLEEMKEVDAYLTQKGLKTDEDKMRYMSAYLEDMANRKGKINDDGLTAILMKYDNEVTYADNVKVLYYQDGSAEAKLKDKTYYLSDCSVMKGKSEEEKTGEKSKVLAQNVANLRNDGR